MVAGYFVRQRHNTNIIRSLSYFLLLTKTVVNAYNALFCSFYLLSIMAFIFKYIRRTVVIAVLVCWVFSTESGWDWHFVELCIVARTTFAYTLQWLTSGVTWFRDMRRLATYYMNWPRHNTNIKRARLLPLDKTRYLMSTRIRFIVNMNSNK